MEIEFVTLGDASERLKVPSPTLRNWTDQLEEFNVHFVKRNNRNERIYYDNDLEIFSFVRDLKKEHGRKTTMKDLAAMIADMGDRFELRSEEDAPSPVSEPSNKKAEILNPDDVEQLMESQRVRALIGYVIGETTKHLREEFQNEWDKDREALKEALREEVKKEIAIGNEQVNQTLVAFKEEQQKRDEEEKKKIAERDAKLMQALNESSEKKRGEEEKKPKGFLAKIFGGS